MSEQPETEVPLDLGDEAQVQAKGKSAKQKQREKDAFLEKTMGTPEGRRWMYDLLSECHIFHNPYRGTSATDTAFACGEMNIGQRQLADIVRVTPDAYILMMKEASKDE